MESRRCWGPNYAVVSRTRSSVNVTRDEGRPTGEREPIRDPWRNPSPLCACIS